MSRNSLLLIITHWKNETYELSRQLKSIKNAYQPQYENKNFTHSSLIKTEDLLKQLLINVDQSSISDQISVLCDFFVNSLKTLLLSSSKIIEKKERSTSIRFPPIIESIETNIKQIGNLINKMNEDCSNEFSKK
jgi:hypothetical protein